VPFLVARRRKSCKLIIAGFFHRSNVLAKESNVKIEGNVGEYTQKAASGNDG
jgi:hypothetical protein